jgi:FMN reductase [NAD(P)H]
MYPNETLRLLNERASLRNFADREIEPDVLGLLMQTACNAPSGGNNQPVSIIRIRDRAMREKLGEMCHQPFIGKAPLNLLFCLDLHRNEVLAETGEVPYTAGHAFRHFWISFQDTLIAAQNVCTAADALGLGSCYIGTIMEFFDECVEMFRLPRLVMPVILVVIGYPAAPPAHRKKFPPEVMVHDETYRDYDPAWLYEQYGERENHRRIPLDDRKEEIFRVTCQAVKGREWADEVMAKVKERGWLAPIQGLYGTHYVAAGMPLHNTGFIASLKRQGIDWFDKWQPADESVYDPGDLD